MTTNVSLWHKIQILLNKVNHIFIGAVAIYMTALGYSHGFEGTARHAFLTSIGFHTLVAEALMSHYPANGFTNRFSQRTKSRIHGLLQLSGGILVLTGVFGKISLTEEHFTTLHGKIGLAATFMCSASILGGIANYFQPKIVQKVYTIAELKYRHNFFGMITFTLGILTIFMGYGTLFMEKYVDTGVISSIRLATVLVYVLTMIAPFQSFLDKMKYRRRR